MLLRAGAGSRLGKLGSRTPRRARAAAEATSTPGSAASERFPNTGFATARSPEAITRPIPRTPLDRLSPSEIPAPLRAQGSGAQDAPGALGLAHVALDGDWIHPRRGVHGEDFAGRGGFRVVPVLPRDAPRPSPAPPDSSPAEPMMFSREVWAALRAGTLDAGGALLHEGRRHDVPWWFNGRFFAARLLPVDEAV
ncbi:hypothetical protein WME97_41970 [Sorangium sp. So ce367]|uniref:hypothetical protein n=1 Tax=Sorangium sp. So ce367 TaxID=3133305 RepID=UPI003F6120D8